MSPDQNNTPPNPNRSYLPLVFTISIALVVVILYACFARWRGLPFSIDPRNVLSLMAPLLLTAGFIERAVEVIISPWRDTQANKLTNELAVLRAPALVVSPAAPLVGAEAPAPVAVPAAGMFGTADQIKIASDKLADYKGTTQQYAFMASLTLSLAAASIGVRALWPLLDMKAKSGFEQAGHAQQGTFLVVDVILSAALLAGGADGIHAVVNSFTTFFNTTAQKAQQSANTPT
jgi:hypothetical protein